MVQASRRGPNPYYSGPVTDHFDGQRFFNPGGVAPGTLRDLLKWQFNGQRARWPKTVAGLVRAKPVPQIEPDALQVTMVGHASMLVRMGAVNILTDPVWSHRASPLSFAGPKRVVEPGIAFDDLPPIHLVLISHNHYDHLDLATIRLLQQSHKPRFVTPLGNDAIIRPTVPDADISVLDWGERCDPLPGIRIHAEPCHHWSARGMRDRRMALWAAFVIETAAGLVYHVGDTGFHEGINYRAAQAKYGGFRLALLPFGAYEPRWFMKGQHQNPAEAVEGMLLCGAAHVAGHHFGTFQLTDEAIDAPVKALEAALSAHDLTSSRFRPLRAGEVFDVPS